MKVTKGTVLHAVDRGNSVVMDRDADIQVDGTYMIGDYMYTVVLITGSRVYVKTINLPPGKKEINESSQ